MTRKKKRRSRRSPRQVSEARLDAKVEREDLNQCYKAAFKQATLLMSDPLHNESVTSIIKQLTTKTQQLDWNEEDNDKEHSVLCSIQGKPRWNKSCQESGEDSGCDFKCCCGTNTSKSMWWATWEGKRSKGWLVQPFVRQLLAQKGALSASPLWNICGARIGNACIALRAQK